MPAPGLRSDVTPQLIFDLRFAAEHFETSPAYIRFEGRPTVFSSNSNNCRLIGAGCGNPCARYHCSLLEILERSASRIAMAATHGSHPKPLARIVLWL